MREFLERDISGVDISAIFIDGIEFKGHLLVVAMDMAQRWAAAALLRAGKKFKRVKGYRKLPKLAAVLQQKSIDRKEAAALV